MTPTVAYKPAGDYSSAEALAIQEYRRATLDYWTVNPATAKGSDRGGAYGAITYGKEKGWREPTQADRVLVSQFEEQRPDLFKPKKSWLDGVSKAVDVAIQGAVIGGLAVGAAGVVGVGPAASGAAPAAGGTGSYSGMALAGGSGPVGTAAVPAGTGLAGNAATVTATASGTKAVASFGSLIEPVTALAGAASSVAGLVGSVKGAGMSAQAGMPAYTAQLAPTRPAGIVNGATAGKQAAWLAIAGLVVAAIFLKG